MSTTPDYIAIAARDNQYILLSYYNVNWITVKLLFIIDTKYMQYTSLHYWVYFDVYLFPKMHTPTTLTAPTPRHT